MTNVLATLDRIASRYAGADWAGIRPADAQAAADLIRSLQARVAAMPPEPPAYDLVAHESVASRSNPIAAAFAINAAHGRSVL